MSNTVLRRVVRATLVVVGAATAAACSGSPTGPSAVPAATVDVAPGPTTGQPPTTTPPSGGPQNITGVGTYRLVSVNGAPVPGPFDSFSPTPGVRMEMVAVRGQIILNDDGTYLHEYETRLRSSNRADVVAVKNVVGMYSLNANELSFRPYQGTPYSPGYAPGRIEVVTEAPGLHGGIDRFVWRYEM